MARFDNKNLQTDNLVDKLVSVNRVSKTVKGGKNMSFSALVVVGDKAGKVGFGKGTEYVKVPGVVGLTLRDARSLLLTNRLTVGAVHHDEPEEEGVTQYVYLQIPDAGERLLEGETVALYLSSDIEKAVKGNTNEPEDESWF